MRQSAADLKPRSGDEKVAKAAGRTCGTRPATLPLH
jgi:hypothetical protein